jgi:hypothetical protein
MKTGTRRMWSRRVLRAGWALAPALKVPAKLWSFFFGTWGSAFWTLFFAVLIWFVTMATKQTNRMETIATSEEITEYVKNSPCMVEMMPRWQKEVKRPLQYGDLRRGKRMCDEVWADRDKIKEQLKVIEGMK